MRPNLQTFYKMVLGISNLIYTNGMYLAVDVGATKTLLAAFSSDGKLIAQHKFMTDSTYAQFVIDLKHNLVELGKHNYYAACIGIPGKVDRKHGVGLAFGVLGWRNVNIQADLEKIVKCPVVVENDANLAGLSEAKKVIKEFKHVLYVTISTGIGTGIITDGVINPHFADSEGGHVMIAHDGKIQTWQSIASGTAIVRHYGKRASDITDEAAWRKIAYNIAIGLIDLIVTIEPQVIIVGGGVGGHFEQFGKLLMIELKKFETPLLAIPPIVKAQRADEAVIYGCFDLAKETYGHIAS